MTLLDREEQYRQNKEKHKKIEEGNLSESPPEKVRRSIYAGFVDRLHNENLELIPEIEKEVYRVIQNFEPKMATKRIMELVWMTRKEWQ